MLPRISLDQWAVLVAVVESGSYASAAARLHKSQSTLTYAIQKIERLTGVKIFETRGRRAVVTESGQVLYRRGKWLIEEAESVEQLAVDLSRGWESELRLAADIIFPTWLLLECLGQLSRERPKVFIQLHETVLSGTTEALMEGRVDLAIGSTVPAGFIGEPLMRVRFVPAAHPDHPLHQLNRPLTFRDLKKHRRLVVRETGLGEEQREAIVADQRWTVTNKATSIHAACLGLGFAWYPEESIRNELDTGQLKKLPMREGGEGYVTVYLMFADADGVGPAARRLSELIRDAVERVCPAGCL